MSDPLDNYSTADLLEITGGCTELTCLYHGDVVRVLRERGAL